MGREQAEEGSFVSICVGGCRVGRFVIAGEKEGCAAFFLFLCCFRGKPTAGLVNKWGGRVYIMRLYVCTCRYVGRAVMTLIRSDTARPMFDCRFM